MEVSWEAIEQRIISKFSDVKSVSTAELAVLLEDSENTNPLIIDARAKKEFDVSHLRGAVHAATTRSALQAISSSNHSGPCVVYCSVGIRSAKLARALSKAGVEEVFNLRGSLFAWFNENRPVFIGDQQVHDVHPYDQKWGQLLNR